MGIANHKSNEKISEITDVIPRGRGGEIRMEGHRSTRGSRISTLLDELFHFSPVRALPHSHSHLVNIYFSVKMPNHLLSPKPIVNKANWLMKKSPVQALPNSLNGPHCTHTSEVPHILSPAPSPQLPQLPPRSPGATLGASWLCYSLNMPGTPPTTGISHWLFLCLEHISTNIIMLTPSPPSRCSRDLV